jgi:hypothetical protein
LSLISELEQGKDEQIGFKKKEVGHQWLMLVILAAQEAEIRRTMV